MFLQDSDSMLSTQPFPGLCGCFKAATYFHFLDALLGTLKKSIESKEEQSHSHPLL